MQKFKAFTLIELLIGMIISSIVITFCYMSYTMISKQYMNYKLIKEELVDALQFNSILNNDIEKANSIHFNENKLIIVTEFNEILEYNFVERYILRNSDAVVDTFNLMPVNVAPNFVLNDGDAENKLLVSFSFDAEVLGELEHFEFHKTYDAVTMVNADFRNLHNN